MQRFLAKKPRSEKTRKYLSTVTDIPAKPKHNGVMINEPRHYGKFTEPMAAPIKSKKITYEEAIESVRRVFKRYPVVSVPLPEYKAPEDLPSVIQKALQRKIKRRYGYKATDPFLVENIAKAQGHICPLCGDYLNMGISRTSNDPDMPTIEHVVPRARGGVHHRNRLITHLSCNNRKGNSMPTGCELIYLEIVNARL